MEKVLKNSKQQITPVNISGQMLCFGSDLEYLKDQQIYYHFDEERGYVMDSDGMHEEFEHDLETVQSNLDEMNHEWLACQAIDNQD